MKDKSIWIDTVEMKKHPSLNMDIATDVLVIGGGITGILCAYELEKRNIDCVLLEQDRIGNNVSKNTTAFLSVQHETLYQDLIKKEGIKKAKEYLELNFEAIKRYKELSYKYDFDFKECSSCMFTNENEEKIIKEKDALEKLGCECELINELPLELKISKGVKINNQAMIHPLKLINELSNELNIYEESKVIKLDNNIAYTKNGKIKFNKVIIATHYPFKNVAGLYFAKLTQRRSYVIASKYKEIEGTYCSIDDDGLYFRSYNDYLIVGGYDRDTKNKCVKEFNKEIMEKINLKCIDYSWSNQDCTTIDGIPYIGKHSLLHPNWYVATGFNLWGFTWAMVSSFVLADLIEEKKYYDIINPHRCYLRKQLFKNVGNSIVNLLKPKVPRCKHLGCALNYNKKEQTYECPCHGSRFDKKGNLLDGPSKKGIKID